MEWPDGIYFVPPNNSHLGKYILLLALIKENKLIDYWNMFLNLCEEGKPFLVDKKKA